MYEREQIDWENTSGRWEEGDSYVITIPVEDFDRGAAQWLVDNFQTYLSQAGYEDLSWSAVSGSQGYIELRGVTAWERDPRAWIGKALEDAYAAAAKHESKARELASYLSAR